MLSWWSFKLIFLLKWNLCSCWQHVRSQCVSTTVQVATDTIITAVWLVTVLARQLGVDRDVVVHDRCVLTSVLVVTRTRLMDARHVIVLKCHRPRYLYFLSFMILSFHFYLWQQICGGNVILPVCLSVCLFVIRISQKVINRFESNFVEW